MQKKKRYNPAVNVMKYYNMDKHVIDMFAAFAITLKENTNMSNEDVVYMLGQVQREWTLSCENGYDLADKCATMYDIDVRRAGK